jgi:hypothetical protein
MARHLMRNVQLSKAVISKTLTENASMLNKDKIICSVGVDDNDI